jgi:hypothetical protein
MMSITANTFKTAAVQKLMANLDALECSECVLGAFLCDLFDSAQICPPKLGTDVWVPSKALYERLTLWTKFNSLEPPMPQAMMGMLLREKFSVFSRHKRAGNHCMLRSLRIAGTVRAPQSLATHETSGCPQVRLSKQPGKRVSFQAPPDLAAMFGSMSGRARNEFLIAACRHRLQKVTMRQDPTLNMADFASFLDGQAKGGDEIAGVLLEQFSAFLRSRA